MSKIGDILIKKGLVTPQQMAVAIEESRKTGEIIGNILLRRNIITQAQLLDGLAEQLCLPFYPNLKDIAVPENVIKAVPAKFVWHYKFMPLKIEGKSLTIAISDPLAVWPMEDLKLHLGYDVERVLATEDEVLLAIRRYYAVGAETVEEIMTQTNVIAEQQKVRQEEVADLEKSAEDASVIKLVNQILSEAITARATDIHIEPFRNKVRVRFRIDGVLYDMGLPQDVRYLQLSIVSRIKILANLNVVERRLPQDGRAIIKVGDKQVDLRISIIPSIYGENVVVRILPMHLLFNLEELGLPSDYLNKLDELMKKPHGIIFLTGPTGSGKTTTLYACLSKLNKDAVKIITIEDPIEYELIGIMQLQIKPEIGFTFAAALRSILRHDPDIMMIGEVRDLETAELSIRTSLTGHLIFSTLHTNDACSGATRLLDIGIEPYLVASSVNAFISQRLVRMICPDCKEEVKEKEYLPSLFKKMKIYQGRGCNKCKNIGYRGRSAIYEILFIDEAIQDLIVNKASASAIRKKAQESGFKTLRDAGIEKIAKGVTTPEEVLRVTELGE